MDEEYNKMMHQRDLDMKIQLVDMTEDQLAEIIDDIDLKTLLHYRHLSRNFIEKYIIKRLDSETTLDDVNRLQNLS